MTCKILLDFETKSRIDIKSAGAGKYCMDPSTEIICFAYAIDDRPVIGVWGDRYPAIFDDLIRKGAVFSAYNSFFEMMIWKHKWRRPLPPFRDTMAKVCAHGLPWPLGKAALALQIPDQKDIKGKMLINRYCGPQKDGTFLEFTPEDRVAFLNYCKQDVEVERKIDLKLPELLPFEQRIWALTQKINERGVEIDIPLAIKAKKMGEALEQVCSNRMQSLTGGRFFGVTQTLRLKEYLNETFGMNLSGIGRDILDDALPSVTDPVAKEIIELRLEYGRSSVAKFDRMIGSVCDDGRIRNYMVYHGASTGRWTSQAVQLQNLPKGNVSSDVCCGLLHALEEPEDFCAFYDEPMSAIASSIRGAIVADEGKTLIVADYNAIEARVLMWMAGQKDAVQMLKDGRDLYVEMARMIYKDPSITKDDKQKRQLGKTVILACGYQMGGSKFFMTCQKFGLDVDPALADLAVQTYRQSYKNVVRFWYDLERTAIETVRSGKTLICGSVKFLIEGDFLYCELPSKRRLAYYKPGIEDVDTQWGRKPSFYFYTQDPKINAFKKMNMYGGKWCENVVQATARDIMAGAMLSLEEAGVPVILSIHDEIVCEVPEWDFTRAQPGVIDLLNPMLRTMCTLPKWAKGCPIAAEGWTGKRYRK
jgi:DNA polymerase